MFNERKSWEYSDAEIIKMSKEVESDLQNFIASRSRWKTLVAQEKREQQGQGQETYDLLKRNRLFSKIVLDCPLTEEIFSTFLILAQGNIQIAVNFFYSVYADRHFIKKDEILLSFCEEREKCETGRRN